MKGYVYKVSVVNGVLGFTFGLMITFVLLMIAAIIVIVIGKYKLFKKAGRNGWEALIPFYSDWILVEIVGLDWWWFLLIISNFVFSNINGLSTLSYVASFIANICVGYNMSKKLHKDNTFFILSILFGGIMYAIAGYSSNYVWDKDVVVNKNGIFGNSENVGSNNNDNCIYCRYCGSKNEKNCRYCINCGKEIKKTSD